MVLITGLGMVTALGNSVPENLEALLSGKQAIRYPQLLQTRHHNELPVGE